MKIKVPIRGYKVVDANGHTPIDNVPEDRIEKEKTEEDRKTPIKSDPRSTPDEQKEPTDTNSQKASKQQPLNYQDQQLEE